jgi:transcriptional regulator with XRE-family HTH domain
MRAQTGEIIRNARKRAGLNLGELADRLECSKTTISLMENGHRPVTPQWAARIEEALNLEDAGLLAQVCWERLPASLRDRFTMPIADVIRATDAPSPPLAPPTDAYDRIDARDPLNTGADDGPDHWTVVPVDLPHIDEERSLAFRIPGRSMLPAFQEGEFVVCATDDEPLDGRICVVQFVDAEHAILARVTVDDDEDGDSAEFILSPVNAAAPTWRIEREDIALLAPATCVVRPIR